MKESKKIFRLSCCFVFFVFINTSYLISEVGTRTNFPGFNGNVLVNGLKLKKYNKSMDKMVRDAICEAYEKRESNIFSVNSSFGLMTFIKSDIHFI
jgi:hypothetical protein